MLNLDCPFDDLKIFPFTDTYEKQFCSSWVATAIVGGSVVAGLSTAFAANKASQAQQSATKQAADTALGMYTTTRGDLAPFREMGIDAGNRLNSKLDFLTSPITMDQATLEQTPGYQFAKTQGLKSVQNSAAARGLGVSGAALKGAANFATGLADQTYKTQFDIENTNRTNAFNRLKSLIDTGSNAAAMTGTAGTNAANTAAQSQIAGGNAAAAGFNAIGSAGANLGNNVAGFAAFKGLFGGPGSSNNNAGNFGGSPATNPNLVPIGG